MNTKLSFEDWREIQSDYGYKGLVVGLWAVNVAGIALGGPVGLLIVVGTAGSLLPLGQQAHNRLKKQYEEYLRT